MNDALRFASRAEHQAFLRTQSALPEGFRVGTTRLAFIPKEAPKPSRMNVTLIALDEPTPSFGAVFTRNAFPGAPVIIGRQRLLGGHLSAIVVNNKVSNVCAPGGVETAERICERVGALLGVAADQVLPSSTGVIGWRLPEEEILVAIPEAIASLQRESVLPAAEGIVTTDLYPKVRRVEMGGGAIVGIAKGAGMIEPNLATMLVYILTDLDVPRDALRGALTRSVDATFNCISIDSDTSTSDTVAILSSRKRGIALRDFEMGLTQLCESLAVDVVRNGEGVHHVIRVISRGAPSDEIARSVGKSIVNSPLFQCAVCGNDPNMGRLVMAIGKVLGARGSTLDTSLTTIDVGGRRVFSGGVFLFDLETELTLAEYLRGAEMYQSIPPRDGMTFRPPVDFPPHERCVEIQVDLHAGRYAATVWGSDRSHEYISENADYRS